MDENNRKGPGIFYAVVGVATLVVAIIGATFAYFTASQTNSDITGTTAEAGGITLTVTPITDKTTKLIPLNLVTGQSEKDTVDQFADALGSAKGDSCKDSNGNTVCQVYSVYVKNKSTTSAIKVRGTLNLDSKATNMKWQLLTNATSTTRAEFATVVDKGVTGNVTVGGNTGGTANDKTVASQTLAGSGEATYYVLVWLEETGAAQEGVDAGQSFTGTVTFNAVDAQGKESGVTASFAA